MNIMETVCIGTSCIWIWS